ncbi:MAG: hypothetical protein PUB49_09455 [Selenomonadaceae bacterium]|nr:hypothetical protein [Selenomonadaceae bacterium]
MLTILQKSMAAPRYVKKLFLLLTITISLIGTGITTCMASPNIDFTCTKVDLKDLESGLVHYEGVLYNSGDEGAYVESGEFSLVVKAPNGYVIFEDTAFSPSLGNVYLAPGESCKKYLAFRKWHSTTPPYTGDFTYHCQYKINWHK